MKLTFPRRKAAGDGKDPFNPKSETYNAIIPWLYLLRSGENGLATLTA